MNTRHHPMRNIALMLVSLSIIEVGAQEYWTQTTVGSYDLSTNTNWESGNTLTSAATDLRFFRDSGNVDLSLNGAYEINNDLIGLEMGQLDLDGQSLAGGRSVTVNGNGFTLADGAVLTLGNNASSGGNSFGYTFNAPVTLGGGLTVSGSPSNPGGITFSSVILPSLASTFTHNSNSRINLNNAALNANHSFAGSGTGGITFGGTLTLNGNRILNVTGSTTPVLGGTITDGGSNYSITKTGSGLLSLAGANHTIGGGVIVQGGILGLTVGGGSINHVSGGVTIQNGSTIRLDWGGTPSGPVVTTSLDYGSGGGTLQFGSGSGNPATVTYSGGISGSGKLTLQHRNNKDSILFSGDYSAYSGQVVVESDSPTRFSQRQAVRFNDGLARFGSALSSQIIVERGGRIGFQDTVTAVDLVPFIFRQGGGITLAGTGGLLDAGVTDPFITLGKGAALTLLNRDNLVTDRISDAANLNMDSNLLNIVGRSSNNSPGTEVVNNINVQGGSVIALDRPNSTAGVRIQASSLTLSGSGNTLFIESTNLLAPIANANNSIIITGSKPVITNGMINPGVQFFTSGNSTGDFVTFSGDNMVVATYTSTNLNTALTTDLVNSGGVTLSGSNEVYALRTTGNVNLGGHTLTLGSGGLIMGSNTHSNGTLDFGSTHAVISAYNGASQGNITATISASSGLTVMGTSQTLNITGANSGLTGGIFVNGGRVRFTTAGANGNNITLNAFGTLVAGTSSGSTDTVGGISGTGTVSGWQANVGSNTSTIIVSPGAGTHTFEGRFTNGNGHILALSKSGDGTQIFGENSVGVHTGANAVAAGTLLVHGDFSGAVGGFSVASEAIFGGNGIIGGDLSLASGALFAFDPNWTLTVNGTVSLDSSFGVASLSGLTSSVGIGAYTLIDGTSTIFGSLGIQNFGESNAVAIGGGKSAYFEEGSLVLHVIPEPGTLALLGLAGLAAMMGLRRRR